MRKREIWIKPEIKQAFETKIAECLAKCNPHHTDEVPIPELVFRNIGGPAGRCEWNPIRRNSIITINPAYFQKSGGYDEQLTNTLPHELAHHICFYIYRNGRDVRPHGYEWARIMRCMGRRPTRCHNMDAVGIVQRHERPYSYKCDCNTPHLLTAKMHLRIQHNGRTRICKLCRSRIVYEGIKVKSAFLPAARPVTPEPVPIKVEVVESKFRVVTKFVDGMFQNVRVPIDNL